MARYVNADAFDERVRISVGLVEEELTEDYKDGVRCTLELLKTQPTADVVDRNECSKCVLYPFKQLRERLETNMVEVVRCKDCKWFDDNECIDPRGMVWSLSEHYCSCGERGNE